MTLDKLLEQASTEYATKKAELKQEPSWEQHAPPACERYEDAPLVKGMIFKSDGSYDENLACNECDGPVRLLKVEQS